MADDSELTTPDEPFITGPDRHTPITSRDFAASFCEDILKTLDLESWRTGPDLSPEYSRLEREAREAVDRELGGPIIDDANEELHRTLSTVVAPRGAIVGFHRFNRPFGSRHISILIVNHTTP